MSLLLFADNASSTLASGISPSTTTITVAASTGALFSAPGAGQYALGTFEDVSGNVEVVQITSRTGDSFVVVRAQEGTTALTFASGTIFEQRVTAGMLGTFLQKQGGDTLSGTTVLSGVLDLGSGGSIQGGEYAGGFIRSQAGDTSNQIHVGIGTAPTVAGSIILSTANIAANLPSGYDLAHTNMIVMWAGTSGSIPAGWHLCDGTNGTPDLRDVFIIGGGGSLPTSGGSSSTTTSATDPSGSLTLGAHALVAGELPTLTYNLWGASGQSTQASNWTLGSSSATVAGYQVAGGSFFDKNGGGQQLVQSVGTGGAGAGAATPHTHAFSGSLNHTHTYQFPPYKAVFLIMKL